MYLEQHFLEEKIPIVILFVESSLHCVSICGVDSISAYQNETSLLQYFLAGVIMSIVLGSAVVLAHSFAGFLTGGSDFQIALSIIVVGGPVAALIVRWVPRVGRSRGEVI